MLKRRLLIKNTAIADNFGDERISLIFHKTEKKGHLRYIVLRDLMSVHPSSTQRLIQ